MYAHSTLISITQNVSYGYSKLIKFEKKKHFWNSNHPVGKGQCINFNLLEPVLMRETNTDFRHIIHRCAKLTIRPLGALPGVLVRSRLRS